MQQLRNLMVSNVEVVRPNSSLKEAAIKMKRMDVGALPVCDGNKVVGIITDRDIVLRVVAPGLRPDETKASDVMSKKVMFCFDDQNVRDAAGLMQKKRIGRLVVLDRNRNLRGIVTLGNLSRHLGEEHFSDLVAEKIEASELDADLGISSSKSKFISALGAAAGVATLIAGVLYYRGQSDSSEELKNIEAA